MRGGNVNIPHKTNLLYLEELCVHDKNGQEKGGSSYTNKVKGKQTKCVGDSTLCVLYGQCCMQKQLCPSSLDQSSCSCGGL